MITAENIGAHEWIGLHVTITKATQPEQQGLDGIIRNETMNTLTLETRKKLIQVQKQGTTFTADFPKEKINVDASLLRFRPEDRVKKGLQKW